MARILIYGTPEFAVPVLTALLAQHDLVGIVTQPDRSAGRGRRKIVEPPVKTFATEHGITVFQPARLRRDKETVAALSDLAPDVAVIAAYGQILRQNVLDIPRLGTIGVHASLLPKLRGAAPITAAIRHGHSMTGISLMLTDAGMDTGAVIAQRALCIDSTDTTGTLSDRLSHLGAQLLIDTLPDWLTGTIATVAQDDALATMAPRISRDDAVIDWTLSAREIDRMVRAYSPWPIAHCQYDDKLLRVLAATPRPNVSAKQPAGTVVQCDREIAVSTGEGLLVLRHIQLAGKRAMDAAQFARGRQGFVGSRLS